MRSTENLQQSLDLSYTESGFSLPCSLNEENNREDDDKSDNYGDTVL